MGLYLCIFKNDEEIDGVEVGGYADFNALRDYITQKLESGEMGSRFPILILHSDCDGEWSPSECEKLSAELTTIAAELKALPAIPFVSEWQRSVARSIGLVQQNAFESFIDVDGEFIISRLQNLVDCSRKHGLPILFQ
jgi:hypothetical protein